MMSVLAVSLPACHPSGQHAASRRSSVVVVSHLRTAATRLFCRSAQSSSTHRRLGRLGDDGHGARGHAQRLVLRRQPPRGGGPTARHRRGRILVRAHPRRHSRSTNVVLLAIAPSASSSGSQIYFFAAEYTLLLHAVPHRLRSSDLCCCALLQPPPYRYSTLARASERSNRSIPPSPPQGLLPAFRPRWQR